MADADDTSSLLELDETSQQISCRSPSGGLTNICNFIPTIVGHTLDNFGNIMGYGFKFENSNLQKRYRKCFNPYIICNLLTF